MAIEQRCRIRGGNDRKSDKDESRNCEGAADLTARVMSATDVAVAARVRRACWYDCVVQIEGVYLFCEFSVDDHGCGHGCESKISLLNLGGGGRQELR